VSVFLNIAISVSINRVSVDMELSDPDWHEGRRLFLSSCPVSWYATIFSIIFDRNETLANGYWLVCS